MTIRKHLRLQEAWDTYVKEVEAYANAQFEAVIKPWLQEKHYKMAHGLYGWVIGEPSGQPGIWKGLDNDDLPKGVLSLLQTAVPGMPNIDLGDVMPDYDATDRR